MFFKQTIGLTEMETNGESIFIHGHGTQSIAYCCVIVFILQYYMSTI